MHHCQLGKSTSAPASLAELPSDPAQHDHPIPDIICRIKRKKIVTESQLCCPGMKNLKNIAATLGLLIGGVAIGQALSYDALTSAQSKSKTDYVAEATAIIRDFRISAIGASSAPQVSQVSNEATAQLMYIQTKQNAEIIRLLNIIASKK